MVVINHPAAPQRLVERAFLRAGVRKPPSAHACSFPPCHASCGGTTPMYRIESIILGCAHAMLAITIIVLALH
jgi:hypothetical protein